RDRLSRAGDLLRHQARRRRLHRSAVGRAARRPGRHLDGAARGGAHRAVRRGERPPLDGAPHHREPGGCRRGRGRRGGARPPEGRRAEIRRGHAGLDVPAAHAREIRAGPLDEARRHVHRVRPGRPGPVPPAHRRPGAVVMTATFTVRSPADGTPLAEVPEQGPHDVAATAQELREAQTEWEAIGFPGRARWLRRYRDWLLDNETALGKTLQSETGKPWFEATIEVPYVVEVINYYTKNGARFLAEETPRPHNAITMTKRSQVLLRPYPLVGIITPWNFPLALALMDGLPALAAGAAVMVKPSEYTPLVTRQAVAGWAEIGAPPVFACMTGHGPTGAAVVDNADYVQFTGSTRTGRIIGARAAKRLVPFSLELGGKDAMLVLDDADVDRAANAAVWGGMCNSGQMCTSVERVYVLAPVYDEFVAKVVDKVRTLRQGRDDQSYRFDVGS